MFLRDLLLDAVRVAGLGLLGGSWFARSAWAGSKASGEQFLLQLGPSCRSRPIALETQEVRHVSVVDLY